MATIFLFNPIKSHEFPTNYIPGWWCNNHLEKYESQWEGLSHILWRIKNVPNHQPDILITYPFYH